jgi:preprotein translocase subunit YajC
MASLGRIAAMKVKRRGTSHGMMVSITSTWLTMQLVFHLQQQQQQKQQQQHYQYQSNAGECLS